MIKILFVDDDEDILASLKRSLFDHEDIDARFSIGGILGLEELKKSNFEVIVSDMRMPEMDGITFIKEAKKICPHAICMILSGYAELSGIMNAINESHVWRFILKPWDMVDLIQAIRNAHELYESQMREREMRVNLAEKNAKLDEFNKELETLVEEKTWELRSQAELLRMSASGEDFEDIFKKSSEMIERMTDNQVQIYSKAANELIIYQGDSDEQLLKKCKEVTVSEKIYQDEEKTIIPIIHGAKKLGALILNMNKKDEALIKKLEGHLVILGLVMEQYQEYTEGGGLIDQIDGLLNKNELKY